MAKITDEDNKKIETAKKKYADAQAKGDKAGMASAHAEAEAVRANYGYSGGADGSQNIALNKDDGSWIGSSPKYSFANNSKGTATDYGSYKDDLERLSRAQSKAQIEQLKQARDKALANLDTQEQSIKPTYQNARNTASATSQSGARSFAEYLANRGLTNSGASAQGEINRLSSLQNTLGGLDTAEANAYRDIANQRTAVNNDYVAGVANANSAIAQQYYNNLLNYNQQQRAMVDQLNQQALGQYSNDYQAQIDNLLAQGYSPNSLEVLRLQALRGNKINNNYSTAMNNAMANIQAGNINYNNAAAVGMTVPQAQAYYNNLVAQQQAQAQAEREALEREIAQQEFENKIALGKLNNDIRNTDSLIASRNNNGIGNSANETLALKDVINILNSTETSQAKNMVDALYNNYQIDDATLQTIYAMNGWSL